MIILPFPPASLSGHNNGAWWAKAKIVATHRAWAFHATRAVKLSVPDDGDIPVHFRFVPPDRRGDRTNYPNRLKPYIDGIAEALGINDRRFLPSYAFADPEKPGRVEIVLATVQKSPKPAQSVGLFRGDDVEESGPARFGRSQPGLTTNDEVTSHGS